MTQIHIDRESALLVIDMQRYFLERGAPAYLRPPPKLVTNVLKLIDVFRTRGLPVVFTRHAHKKGNPTGQMGMWWDNKLPWEGDMHSKLINAIAPKKGEKFITKTYYSAFEKTNLERYLKKKGVRTVYICGVMTNLCIETTARHAFMKGFQPVIIEDACAANTRAHHRASILNLSYGFAHVLTMKEMLNTIPSFVRRGWGGRR